MGGGGPRVWIWDATAIGGYKKWHTEEGKGHLDVGGIWVAYCIGVDWGSSHEATGTEAWSLVTREEPHSTSQVGNDLQVVEGV